ncbi:hypothetical protein [Sulfurimonas sp. CS5]|uniref:hypothetical protein n=1 Tax=Sulfurimonas sp. CS5 TaxID=3391145 RepID=UPI0039EB90A5
MINILKKEFIIYTALLTLLIFLMHPDMLSDPVARLGLMQEKANYIHPLLYTLFVYLVLFFLRAVSGFIAKLFEKK